MMALGGMALLLLMGAVLRAVVTREPLGDSLASPTSFFFALGLLFASSLGFAGVVLGTSLLVCARLLPRPDPPVFRSFPLSVGVVGVIIIARPWFPTCWDEFVWLAKARLESLEFGAGVRAALDASLHLVPPGYPPLWPSAVGWIALGEDRLETHVVAAALLVVLCVATAAEAWVTLLRDSLKWPVALALVIAAPFVWVHARLVYVDLPIGLLGLAVLGFLLTDRLALACVVAVSMAGFKDEGLAHVLAATLGAVAVKGFRKTSLPWLLPAFLAGVAVVTWRWLLAKNGVVVVDHALSAPAFSWASTFGSLLVKHASDVWTWGVFWAVSLGVLFSTASSTQARALRWALLAGFGFVAVALFFGPERVRVFAENGTLINRLLVQLWPTAAVMISVKLTNPPTAATA